MRPTRAGRTRGAGPCPADHDRSCDGGPAEAAALRRAAGGDALCSFRLLSFLLSLTRDRRAAAARPLRAGLSAAGIRIIEQIIFYAADCIQYCHEGGAGGRRPQTRAVKCAAWHARWHQRGEGASCFLCPSELRHNHATYQYQRLRLCAGKATACREDEAGIASLTGLNRLGESGPDPTYERPLCHELSSRK